MKMTVCDPAGTLWPTFGVLPIGRPSRTTFDTGIEFMLRVPVPAATVGAGLSAGSADGAGAGLSAGLSAGFAAIGPGTGAGAGAGAGATAGVAEGVADAADAGSVVLSSPSVIVTLFSARPSSNESSWLKS